MNAVRFQPINANLLPGSVQVVLLENRTGRGAGMTHTPHLSGKPEVRGGPPGRAPASPGSYSCTDWQEVREELLPFSSQLGPVQFPSCSAISRAPGRSEMIKGAANLAGTAKSPS